MGQGQGQLAGIACRTDLRKIQERTKKPAALYAMAMAHTESRAAGGPQEKHTGKPGPRVGRGGPQALLLDARQHEAHHKTQHRGLHREQGREGHGINRAKVGLGAGHGRRQHHVGGTHQRCSAEC